MLLQRLNIHEVQTPKHAPRWTKSTVARELQAPGREGCLLTEAPVAGSTGAWGVSMEGAEEAIRPESLVHSK